MPLSPGKLAAEKRRPQNASHPYLAASNSLPFPFAAGFVLILLFLALPALSAVREVAGVGLTVNDLNREVEFFTNVLPFVEVSKAEVQGRDVDQLFGLQNTRLEVADLKLGQEHITLTEHLTSKGRPIPADSRSYDHWFQHIAIVVSDMDKAYERLRQHRVTHVSTSPQTLPVWNTNAAGIKAFYFRDPEDHVLEIIWFPPGKGDPKWQQRSRSSPLSSSGGEEALFLGVDHAAIVVSNTDKSLAFYRGLLGMRVAGESENYGVEQEHLNQVFGARLRITALRAQSGPGIEFLEYIAPPGGRNLPGDAKPNDLVFWRTDLRVDRLDDLVSELKERRASFVSAGVVSLSGMAPEPVHSLIVRDPDGHALQLVEESPAAISSPVRVVTDGSRKP